MYRINDKLWSLPFRPTIPIQPPVAISQIAQKVYAEAAAAHDQPNLAIRLVATSIQELAVMFQQQIEMAALHGDYSVILAPDRVFRM